MNNAKNKDLIPRLFKRPLKGTMTVSGDGLFCFREGTMKGGPLKMPI